MVLRLRGGPGGGSKKSAYFDSSAAQTEDDEDFESLNLTQMAGLSEHVVYNISVPVSIASKESAVLPISSAVVDGSRVLVYDPKVNEVNATRSIHLRNTTGLVLAPGKISVLEGGRFVAQNEFTPMLPDDEALISYGEDSTVGVTVKHPKELQHDEVDGIEIEYSSLHPTLPINIKLSHKKIRTTVYTIKNNSLDREVKKFYIDHTASTAHGGFEITTSDKCIKSVTGFNRYELSLAPNEQVEFEVAEEAFHMENLAQWSVSSFLAESAPTLLQQNTITAEQIHHITEMVKQRWLGNVRDTIQKIQSQATQVTSKMLEGWRNCSPHLDLPPDLWGKMEEAIAHRESMAELERQIQVHSDHIEDVHNNQDRLRKNITSLEKVSNSSLVARYLADLDREEDDLLQTRSAIESKQEECVQLENKAKKLISQILETLNTIVLE
uniref:Uncharacterized protein n=1 Tax=Fibrocapsa japonica TaxID=94617 RepID=A0A7S2Y101_9STRA